jgi:hypothetical protein
MDIFNYKILLSSIKFCRSIQNSVVIMKAGEAHVARVDIPQLPAKPRPSEVVVQ